jgi:hypothetical protein
MTPHGTELVPQNSKVVPVITPWYGPRRKRRFQQFLYCCVWIRCRGNMFVCEGLRICCIAADVVSFFVSRSLPSNGSTRYNVHSSSPAQHSIFRLINI